MSNATHSGGNGSCSPYDSPKYVNVTIVAVAVSLISFLACLVVIGVIFLFKKYHFFTQRHILYLSIAALFNSAAITLRLHYLTGNTSKEHMVLCVVSAALEQTTAWSQLLAVCCITLIVFIKVVLMRDPEKPELYYVFVIFIFPLLINWIPFIHSSYGHAGAWCWIRNEDKHCKSFEFGNYLRFILWYVPLYLLLVALIVAYFIIIVKIRRLNHHWKHRRRIHDTAQQQEMTVTEIRPLLWYPLFYILLSIPSLVNRISEAVSTDPELTLWYFHALFGPLQGGFISLAYAMDSETLCRCSQRCLSMVLGSSKSIEEYPATRAISDSLSQSMTMVFKGAVATGRAEAGANRITEGRGSFYQTILIEK